MGRNDLPTHAFSRMRLPSYQPFIGLDNQFERSGCFSRWGGQRSIKRRRIYSTNSVLTFVGLSQGCGVECGVEQTVIPNLSQSRISHQMVIVPYAR